MPVYVALEKVTYAANVCLGKHPPHLCCRLETREKIQTKITPVPLPEKCAHPPFVQHSLQISSLLGGKGQIAAAGIMCM